MKEDLKNMLEKNLHSIIVHATVGIKEVNLPVIEEIKKRAIMLFESMPNDRWHKVADKLPPNQQMKVYIFYKWEKRIKEAKLLIIKEGPVINKYWDWIETERAYYSILDGDTTQRITHWIEKKLPEPPEVL